jgi:hypothetical protein
MADGPDAALYRSLEAAAAAQEGRRQAAAWLPQQPQPPQPPQPDVTEEVRRLWGAVHVLSAEVGILHQHAIYVALLSSLLQARAPLPPVRVSESKGLRYIVLSQQSHYVWPPRR